MEKGYPKNAILKGGKSVVLRPLEKGDVTALGRFFSALPPESTEFLRDDVRDPAVVQRFISELNPERVWSLLALDDKGQIVGDATLHVAMHGWRRHVGEIRVVVAPSHQRSRLATSLIHDLVNQASLRGLRKLEAQVLDSQVGALTAFQRLGFREEARLKEHALDRHDKPHDLLILTNTVEDLWRKMEDLISDQEFQRDAY